MTTSRDQAPDLFGTPEGEKSVEAPLAERLRPREFADFVGQDDITAPDRPLRRAIEADQLSSVIFWGPPGSGKTTLAHLVARHTKAQFVPFSAVTGGVPELRAIIKTAEQRQAINGQRTILFVDEIHRFNKAQQDAFLPHVERGTVILVGATTENPSFEVISPLLSRSLVIVLKPLSDEALGHILDRALADPAIGLGKWNARLSPDAGQRLIAYGNGDARALLTALDFVVKQQPAGPDGTRLIDGVALEAALMKKSIRYDKSGEEHYNVISAYIKSLRDSDPNGALYWLARMLEGGEDRNLSPGAWLFLPRRTWGMPIRWGWWSRLRLLRPCNLWGSPRRRSIWPRGRPTSRPGEKIMPPISDFLRPWKTRKPMEI